MTHKQGSDHWVLWPVSDLKDVIQLISQVWRKNIQRCWGLDTFAVATLAKTKQAKKLGLLPYQGKKKIWAS